jgi:hypothetical protein
LLCLLFSTELFSNDGYYFFAAGGSAVPAENNKTYVEMKEEIINIDIYDDYYKVTVDFTFFNNGEDENLLVGFPYVLKTDKQARSFSSSIYNFKTWVDNQLVEHSNNEIDASMLGSGELQNDYVFTKNVFFSSQQTTTTKVEYYAKYGVYTPYEIATYFYGSGLQWYGSIGKITINIQNNIENRDSKKWIYDIKAQEIDLRKILQWNEDAIKIVLTNIEPAANDIIEIHLGVSLFDFGPKVFPNDFYYRESLLKANQLSFFTKSQLRILRNVYYAFYGYNFRDIQLKQFFSEYYDRIPWYTINNNFNEAMLTASEKRNIEIIMNEEQKR